VETVLTVSEVAKVLRRLEGRFGLSARSIRYYARTGMVTPTGVMRESERARATRLYTTIDVALLRVVCRLQRQRVHERAIWGALVYRGDELRHLLTTQQGEFVVDIPAALAITSEDRTLPKPIHLEVTSVMSGLAERLAAFRRAEPKVWTGLARMDAADAWAEVSG
jgi:DNA-binding transcriptional MerR regulator